MSQTPLTYKVEIDVSGGAFGSAFSATDVSSKAVAGLGFEPVTVTWGRQDQFSAVNPTSVSGALLNTDGTFSPGNTSGTYYPRIRRGLRRRVSVGVNSTTVHLSEDYATSLEVVPAKDSPAVTNVSGSDILARFGGTPSTSDPSSPIVGTALRSFLAEEMLVDSPTCLYMLQEADGATSFADITGTCSPLVVTNSKYGAGTVTAGQSATGTFYGGTLVNVANSHYGTSTRGGSWLETSQAPAQGSTFSVELWIQTPASAPASVDAQLLNWGNVAVLINATTGKVQVGAGIVSPASICDGGLHHLVITQTASVTQQLYIDGVSVASTGLLSSSSASTNLTVGALDDGLGGVKLLSAGIAYLGTYAAALSSSRITTRYQAGVTAFAGERTDQRVTRLLSYRTNTGSSLDTGLGTVGVQSITGRSLQDCLLEVGQVEAGAVFVDGIGQVNFRSRSRLFNPTPTVTLDMSAGGVDFGSNWREDTQGVINDAIVTNSTTGSDQRFYSASSITTDGELSTSYSLPLNADADALNLAGWIVVNGTQQQLTATPLIVNLLHLTAAQAQAVLQLAPLDCIQLTHCPAPAPASTMTFIVQGGVTSLASDAATVTLNLTPLPYPVGVWDSTLWDATTATWAF